MANHSRYNKIIRKLNGRSFRCKTFYDIQINQVLYIKPADVFLKKEVEEMLNELRLLFEEQEDKIVVLERKASDLEVENYGLKRKKKNIYNGTTTAAPTISVGTADKSNEGG